MKRILLTSTALVAFAGAAVADVTWKGDSEFGYNDEVEDGFYFDAGIVLGTDGGMNNGISAGFTFDIDFGFLEDDGANRGAKNNASVWKDTSVEASDFVFFVKSETASMYFGDTKTAIEKSWDGVTNMEEDNFLEDGDVDDGEKKGDYVDAVLRFDFEAAGAQASISQLLYTEDKPNADDHQLGAMQIAVKGEYNNFLYSFAYQEEDTDVTVNGGSVEEIIGLMVGGSFGGADVKLAYISNETDDENSVGIEVTYPVTPNFEVTAFYSSESRYDDDNYGIELAYQQGRTGVDFWYHDGTDQEIGIEGSFKVTEELMLYAGYIENDDDDENTESYIAGKYDLGGGAGLLVSYGDAGDNYTGDNDEIGDNFEVNEGTTVALTFKF